MKSWIFGFILVALFGCFIYGCTNLPWWCCACGGMLSVWIINLIFTSVLYITDKNKGVEQSSTAMSLHNQAKLGLLAILVVLIGVGIYVYALNTRYKHIAGITVMDTWTQTLLAPDSTGQYKPCPIPFNQ